MTVTQLNAFARACFEQRDTCANKDRALNLVREALRRAKERTE